MVLAALGSNTEYAYREHGEKEARVTALGQAISYRFKRDSKGWRVFATTELPEVEVTTDRRRGAVGVDLNADHLAVAETDASGNYVNAWRVPLVTYGKNTNQAEALIGDAVASVVQYAREVGKPIVIENLDFRQKKAALEGQSRKYSRMLSSFSYGKIKAYFISRGYRQGVEVHQVNPAYSSVMGRVKFMERYGLTVHQAAGPPVRNHRNVHHLGAHKHPPSLAVPLEPVADGLAQFGGVRRLLAMLSPVCGVVGIARQGC